MELALAGQPGAFGEIVRGWHARVTAYCHAWLGACSEADDATQETFIRAHAGLTEGRLMDIRAFGSWLRGIARHVCLDTLRDRQRRQAVGRLTSDEAAQAIANEPDPSEQLVGREQRDRVIRCVESLPDDCREVVLLHYYEEMSYSDMAAWLGVSRATVNERLRKGRELLRIRLGAAMRTA
ncbi:MAG: sigma-70 family RNA polymerase sigma factor [Planctomycetales bacterium]|nr:sigma-70 family RNA polymerase sigma factor [Planctomycetales bacterium]